VLDELLLLVGAGSVVAGLVYLNAYVLVWTAYCLAGVLEPSPPVEWGLEEVQARVVTVGENPDVVQATVDSVPDAVGSVHVVSERPIEADGATVWVVDGDFRTDAIGKGRALEWARQTIPCEEEYVLFLDEDTIVGTLEGLPDADVVQFAEKPTRNRSTMAWLTDVFRVGNGLERGGFARLVPIYAWGGGIAIRKRVEDDITWDRPTIVEDSVFVRTALSAGHSYAVDMTRFGNQAPPSLSELVRQRRRWGSGRFRDAPRRSIPYRALLSFHTLGRPLSAFAVPLVLAGYLLVPVAPLAGVLSSVVVAALVLWAILGWQQYDASVGTLATLMVSLPVVTFANGFGDLQALVSPVEEFETTDKSDVTAGISQSDH